MIKSSYRKCRTFYHKLKFYCSVNWTKTLYFNFKKFPFQTAKKLPIFFYKRVKFTSISGEIQIDGKIQKGMIGFGQPYELNTVHRGIAEINIQGKLIFKGKFQFGKDYFLFVGENAVCELGNMSSMASNAKLICLEKVILGNYVRLGAESQIIDTNFHDMIDTVTGEKQQKTGPIFIGNYNFSGSRISIMKNTKTPDFCTIATNSFCNKDYTSLGNTILIGGIPAKLIRTNISRDWEGEKEQLEDFLTI
ncbi:acyltransferase [Flavobacterium denitrificans]|uniref:acyltransferase n=1 Tax=Flavobacterium denitrificans TaxID=281361 RepID=UPI001FD86CDB|nr:transferase [Flavobacterium denitrificans]